jgi:methyl-accepting chemotaxis protein
MTCSVLLDLDGTLIDSHPGILGQLSSRHAAANFDSRPVGTMRSGLRHIAVALVLRTVPRKAHPIRPNSEGMGESFCVAQTVGLKMASISVRGRIAALAAILLLFSLAIAGTAWHALTETSETLLESVRAGNYLGYIIVSFRELSGADRRIINFIQTGREDDEQRFAKRKADTEVAFAKALDLVQDPVRRQAMLNIKQGIQDFFANADDLIRERRALGQRAAAIRDGLVALGATSASDQTLDTYLEPLQRDAQATLLTVLDPSGSSEQSLSGLVDVAGPATGRLAQLAMSGRSRSGGDATSQPGDAAPRRFTGASQTASNSAAAIDTRLLLVSKKAEEVAKSLPAGNPAADGLTRILVVTAIVLIAGTLLTGFTTRWVGGPLDTISAAMARLAGGGGAVEIPDMKGTDQLSTMAAALKVLKQNADRIAALATAMTRIAGGDRSVEIPELQGAGEIGAMARSVQEFKQKSDRSEDGSLTSVKIRSIAGVVARAAGGDLTARVAVDGVAGPLKEFGDQINLLLDNSSTAVKELAEYVRGVVVSLSETRAAADKVSAGSKVQTDTAANVAADLAQSVIALKNMCATVALAKGVAGNMSELCEQGLVAVDRLAALVEQIFWSSRSINEKSRVIAEIASRTQFLCLNASIEAARLGEQGKSFAVVTQEVGKLAESASQNSKQLAALVEQESSALADGKATTDLVCRSIKDLIDQSHRSTDIIDSSAAGLDDLSARVSRLESQVAQLRGGANQSAGATKDITVAIDWIEKSAEAARSRIASLRLDDWQGARIAGA